MSYARLWTIDYERATVEALPPVEYLSASYYKRWFLGLEHRIVHYGLAAPDEIAAGHSLRARRRAQSQAHGGRRRTRC